MVIAAMAAKQRAKRRNPYKEYTEQGIQTMCTVMEELRIETLIEAIKSLKSTQHWTNEQALTALNIDKSKWPRIIAVL